MCNVDRGCDDCDGDSITSETADSLHQLIKGYIAIGLPGGESMFTKQSRQGVLDAARFLNRACHNLNFLGAAVTAA